MENKDQPAFANPGIKDSDSFTYNPGLTKREYFAGLAMQGMLANSEDGTTTKIVFEALGLPAETKYEYPKHWMQYIAISSVAAADALIAELNK